MSGRLRSRTAVIWIGVLVTVGVTILLAPIITVGWCGDAGAEGTSVCGTSHLSLLGAEANVWVWLIAVAATVVVTVVAARRTRS